MQEASRDTVLKELRALIWAHRPRLLEAFQTFDRTSLDSVVQEAAGPDYDPDITGAVEPAIWARVLGGALRTPADFPWAELRPHLAELTADGLVSYMDFLSRFRNPLESWLTRARLLSCLSGGTVARTATRLSRTREPMRAGRFE